MASMQGIDKARKHMQERAKAFKAQTPKVYAGLSAEMATAIDINADESYDGSPAKVTALNSVRDWVHGNVSHALGIMSLYYANYRQYGCGGITIVKLVVVKRENIEKMKTYISKAFHR